MSKAALLELAERVEKASGPDRELDALICIAIDDRPSWASSGKLISQRLGHVSVHPYGDNWSANIYTSSLDAAKALAPDGMSWAAGDLNEDDVAWCCLTDANGIDFCGTAESPTLATVSASLRARAEMEPSDAN